MKYLVMLLAFTGLTAYGQVDTVYVNTEGTTYMVFDNDIEIFNFGNAQYTGAAESGNMLFLKATQPGAKATTLLVKSTGGKIFMGFIGFKNNPEKPFWDLRKEDKDEVNDGLIEDANILKYKGKNTLNIEKKMLSLLNERKNDIASEVNNNISLTLHNVANDKEASYFRFNLRNNSTVIYHIDFISLSYKDQRKAKKRNTVENQNTEVLPISQNVPESIQPLSDEELLFAVPLYSPGRKGFLEVIIREKKGVRAVIMNVKSKKIAKAKLL
ncbi:DUF4138 domain-containing protein [Dyadobacter psychrotolerans]|uniref:DUF4138 domain-containing protein n=1 Tax=Dyadobacter psychrotolerans TaxID=2541721 RepID=A0A4R5DA79_9BACT|nr:DUF4138 domain-containing protein [Dyadobacter psychrotolerans]TDE08681.1 DUF4138 domain-containing protein [Dyadobacter psychrotolerans]